MTPAEFTRWMGFPYDLDWTATEKGRTVLSAMARVPYPEPGDDRGHLDVFGAFLVAAGSPDEFRGVAVRRYQCPIPAVPRDAQADLFRQTLLKTLRGISPAMADEIGPLLDNPEQGKAWLRDHGFHVPADG